MKKEIKGKLEPRQSWEDEFDKLCEEKNIPYETEDTK